MFRSQVINTVKKSWCKPYLHNANSIFGFHQKECTGHAVKFYCISKKDEYFYEQSRKPLLGNETNGTKLIREDDITEVVKFGELKDTDSQRKQLHPEESKKNANDINNVITKSIENAFPSPVHTLKMIYAIVANEFKDQNMLSFKFDSKKHAKTKFWSCTCNVKWPTSTQFVGLGYNKSTAEKNAALKCLAWLQANNKINRGKPVLYSQEEIRNLSQKHSKIDIDPKIKDEIKTAIKTYSNEIEDIVANLDTSNVEKMLPWLNNSSQDELHTHRLPRYRELNRNVSRDEKNLPIMEYRAEIVDMIENNKVCLIKGETGCGKTTQVPQFIMDSFIDQQRGTECNIMVSQPRRISAMSIATRVAKERQEFLGDVVGYHVRLNSVIPQFDGTILFCTTGILLRRLQVNPNLKGISHVILDEAHERSVQIDMLMVLLKRALQQNPDLKLIVMSATINTGLFQRYFECPVIEIPGKMYPVKMHFLDDIKYLGIQQTNVTPDIAPVVNHRDVVKLIHWICQNKPSGSILCFLPGWSDILYVQRLLQKCNNNMLILTVHSRLTNHTQNEIFKPAEEGVRKIILSTDVAESGITITDVSYVIDTAIKKAVQWDGGRGATFIGNQWITKANILQRKGRAGRVKPGESYHLILRRDCKDLRSFPLPEVHCVPLDQFLLMSKAYSSEKANEFFSSMPEPPKAQSIYQAIDNLSHLGIIDSEENLTALGRRLVQFALPPALSRAVVYSAIFECVNPILTIATIFSTDNIFTNILLEKAIIQKQKQSFHSSSDHIAMLSIYDDWINHHTDDKLDFCTAMNIRPSKLAAINKIYQTYMDDLVRCHMIPENYTKQCEDINIKCSELIPAILFAATNQLLKRKDVDFKKGYMTKSIDTFEAENKSKVILTRDSVNYKREDWPSAYLTYLQHVHNSDRRCTVVSETSMISPLAVFLFSQTDIQRYQTKHLNDDGQICFRINNLNNLRLCCDKETFTLLLDLRKIIWSVVDYILHEQGTCDVTDSQNLHQVLQYKTTLVKLLSKMLDTSDKNIES